MSLFAKDQKHFQDFFILNKTYISTEKINLSDIEVIYVFTPTMSVKKQLTFRTYFLDFEF
jgi:hypothetical protein